MRIEQAVIPELAVEALVLLVPLDQQAEVLPYGHPVAVDAVEAVDGNMRDAQIDGIAVVVDVLVAIIVEQGFMQDVARDVLAVVAPQYKKAQKASPYGKSGTSFSILRSMPRPPLSPSLCRCLGVWASATFIQNGLFSGGILALKGVSE